MTWSRSGVVEVTNGTTGVVGTGTEFLTQRPGWLLWLFGDRPYEIATITSATALQTVDPIERATASNLRYLIIPTQGDLARTREAIDELIELVNNSRLAWDQVFEDFAAGNYQLWLNEGNTGSIQDFLDFLRGPQGLSAYEVWLDDGNIGTLADFWEFLRGPRGFQGERGWSPVYAAVEDGARRVFQVAGWIGGEGTPPATGQYLGNGGLVAAIGDATDYRGAEGPPGPQGAGLVLSGVFDTVTDLNNSGQTSGNWLVGTTSPRDVYIWNATLSQFQNGGPLEGPEGPAGTTDYNLLNNLPSLGSAAAQPIGAFATAAQGQKADTALQPGALPGLVTVTEAQEGSVTTSRLWSPERVAQAIAALAGSGAAYKQIDHINIPNTGPLNAIDAALPDGHHTFHVFAHLTRSGGSGNDIALRFSSDGGVNFAQALGQYTDSAGASADRILLGSSSAFLTIEATIKAAKVATAPTFVRSKVMQSQAVEEESGQYDFTTAVNALRIFSGGINTLWGDIWIYGLEDT